MGTYVDAALLPGACFVEKSGKKDCPQLRWLQVLGRTDRRTPARSLPGLEMRAGQKGWAGQCEQQPTAMKGRRANWTRTSEAGVFPAPLISCSPAWSKICSSEERATPAAHGTRAAGVQGEHRGCKPGSSLLPTVTSNPPLRGAAGPWGQRPLPRRAPPHIPY